MLRAEILKRIEAVALEGSKSIEQLRRIRKDVSKQIAEWDLPAVLQLAHDVISFKPFGRFFACELVTHHFAAMESITRDQVESLGKGMSTWAEVDTFSIYIAGPAWRNRRLTDAVLKRWAKSENRWWRRAALVSTVPLNSPARGGEGDAPRTLLICGMLLGDRDDMVVKAMSWALRALAKREPEVVRNFLSDNHEGLAARVYREVTNKLTTGRKSGKP